MLSSELPAFEAQTLAPGLNKVWSDAEAKFYMEGITQSDYAEAVGGRMRDLLGPQEALLDVGAGVGTISRPLLAHNAQWTAVEPSPFLAGQLRTYRTRWPYRLNVLQTTWQTLSTKAVRPHDVCLAANTCGPLDNPQAFWTRLRPFARNVMIWVVPAQVGPHGICLSGFLPPELHREDMVPPVHGVLSRLGDLFQPDRVDMVPWEFRYRFKSREAAGRYFEHRFNQGGDPEQSKALAAHLDLNLVPILNGWLASAPKLSACLTWSF